MLALFSRHLTDNARHCNRSTGLMTLLRSLSLFVFLLAVWLLLSGHYDMLIVGFGLVSCLAVVLIARRMDIVDREGHPIHLTWRAPIYWLWLLWEIAKSNLAVVRAILGPRAALHPRVIRVEASQESDIGLVTFANSITLTPGTVSILVNRDWIDVHALTQETADGLMTGEMNRMVCRMEGTGAQRRGG